MGSSSNETLREKIHPKIIKFSKCHLTILHISLLTKVFDIKFDIRKLKTEKDFGKWNIMMKV